MSEKPVDVPYLPLESWSRRWELDGTQVRCKTCRAQQDCGSSSRAFTHRLDCSALKTAARHPLKDLHKILKDQIDKGLV